MTAPDWKNYQEQAAGFFRHLGLEARTDVTIKGARTTHNVDVVVTSRHAGFEVTWLVECKLWNTKVTKLHVLALREIVADTGADRGILLAEAGFQSGSIEAAQLTNVHLTSLANVQKTASAEITAMRLRELYDRIEVARARYWEIPKYKRIEAGLRPDVSEVSYSGALMINLASDALGRALRGVYPFELETSGYMIAKVYGMPNKYDSAESVIASMTQLVEELEAKLNTFDQRQVPPAT